MVFCHEFTWRHHFEHPFSSCGSKRKCFLLNCTGNVNIPELHTIARCASERSHENLHKVYWTHSAGLRNRFWPILITILAGLSGSVGCPIRLETRRSRVQPLPWSATFFSWRLIMKYFLRSFCPFPWFKKGSCQFLAKECAQYWLTA